MKINLTPCIAFLFFCSLFLAPLATQAHSPDQSYLYFRIYGEAIGGRVELTAKDMNRALGINMPKDLSMEALQPYLSQVQAYIKSKVAINPPNGSYTIRFVDPEVLNLEEMDDFVRFHFELDGVQEIPDYLDVSYDAIFETDSKHRGLMIVEYNWKAGIVDNESFPAYTFSPSDNKTQLSLTDASMWKGFVALVKLGIWHIWIGLDHILFIVALIIPAVVRRKDAMPEVEINPSYSDTWIPVPRFKPAFLYIIKIITFFTIAHSITLALAALDIVTLPSRFVESIIALSIALAALHNITPIFKGREWLIAFGFGLFHGFGFAGVLGEKGLSGDFLTLSLLGFNVGVELGQLLIICMIFPFLYFFRKQFFYPKFITYGSIVLILISLYWVIERGFDVDLPLGAYFWKFYNGIFG